MIVYNNKCIITYNTLITLIQGGIFLINIDLQSRIPIYEQLRRGIIELIIKGVLKENDQLPSIRSLAKELNINPNTIAKAYQMLEHDKIIYSTMGRGSFVSPVNETIVKNHILSDFDECTAEALKSGISKEELIERINNSGVNL